MFIKLPVGIRRDALWPSGVTMSDMDRVLDIMLEIYPTGEFKYNDIRTTMVTRWGWDTLFSNLVANEMFDKFIATYKQYYTVEDGFLVLEDADSWYDTKLDRPEVMRQTAQKIIDAFNIVTGRKITLNPPRERIIMRRLKEGAKLPKPIGLAQFEAVFKHKYAEWKEDEKMSKYFEIETLCSEKFYKYLDQAREAFKEQQRKGKAGRQWYVLQNVAERTVRIGTSENIFHRKLSENPDILIGKFDLYELADRRARDYATEKQFTLTTDGATIDTTKESAAGQADGQGHQ